MFVTQALKLRLLSVFERKSELHTAAPPVIAKPAQLGLIDKENRRNSTRQARTSSSVPKSAHIHIPLWENNDWPKKREA